MMRKVITGFFTLFSLSFAVAQSSKVQPNEKLFSKYSAEEVKSIQQDNPEKIKFLNFIVDEGYTIMPIPEGKVKKTPEEIDGEVDLENSEDVNIFALGIEFQKNDWQYYKIKGTGNMLVVYSEDYIREYLYNKQK